MKERRYPFSLFLIGFIMNVLFRFFWIFILPSIILLIVGIWVDWCLYAGLALLGVDIIISFVEQMIIRHTMLSESDNEQFRKLQDAVSSDGNTFENIRGFVENAVEEAVDVQTQMNNFVVDMCDDVCKKCEYGDDIEKLNEYERVFYVTQILEQEVNNGGFSQFFFNSSGDFSNELVESFTIIGAVKTAEICKKALSVFKGDVPTDREEREEMLDSLECEDALSECDKEFFEYKDNLQELNYTFIMEHRSFFD